MMPHFARYAAALLVLAALATPAQAQPATPSDTWTQHVAEQIATALDSPRAAVQERTMQLVIELAHRYPEVDLAPVVPGLLKIYRWDRDRGHRLMALAALHAVGDEYGMARLADLGGRDPSLTVRNLTYAAVADHRAQQ